MAACTFAVWAAVVGILLLSQGDPGMVSCTPFNHRHYIPHPACTECEWADGVLWIREAVVVFEHRVIQQFCMLCLPRSFRRRVGRSTAKSCQHLLCISREREGRTTRCLNCHDIAILHSLAVVLLYHSGLHDQLPVVRISADRYHAKLYAIHTKPVN